MNNTEEIAEVVNESKQITIALVGNPNSGKSSLFNQLTGLRQKIGNYPGVTVDKKIGTFQYDSQKVKVIDLPGTYSIYPKSSDETVVTNVLLDPENESYPDVVVVILDESNLKRNLLLFTQINDLGLPVVAVLNMVDVANRRGIHIDPKLLESALKCPVLDINARTGEGIDSLKETIINLSARENQGFLNLDDYMYDTLETVKTEFKLKNCYQSLVLLNQTETLGNISDLERDRLRSIKDENKFEIQGFHNRETLDRYKVISNLLSQVIQKEDQKDDQSFTEKIDKILTHKVWGYVIFISILLIIFQTIFSWAEAPMDWIDMLFGNLSFWVQSNLPQGVFVDMLAEGIIPGIGGIVIFIPQIALLFGFIAILEDSGYMSRAVFLMDKIMRKFGLSGKSVVPLISGVACAIPSVMATRNIENWKERLITIMVTPLMTCSARLPVYIILISLVVPNESIGLLNLQGITLFVFYFLGFLAAILASMTFNRTIKSDRKSFLIMEMPSYKAPRWNNVFYTMVEKSKTFVFQAGKIIIAISLILWVLASFGPKSRMDQADAVVQERLAGTNYSETDYETAIGTYKLENSYVGILGKTIEPVIRPLGFDWKIGIALITSFAAREVFVSTIATIYSVGEDFEEGSTLKAKMLAERNPETGKPVYTPAVAFSLLMFYAFAMQCMSTIAIVKRETKSWKWPLIQLGYMTALAYISSFITYQVISNL